MTIIDTHVHLGKSKFSGVESHEADILNAMDRHGVTTSLVMPQPTLDDVRDVHTRIGAMAKQYPGRIYGMASIDPWWDAQQYHEEVKRCVEDMGFVALKLHPLGHNVSPLSPICDKVYEAAAEYGVPVLVHTGTGNPFALPSLLLDAAKRFPSVSFILCHAGFAVYTDEAIVAAKYADNIYLEPSWCPTYTIVKMVKEVGIEKIIMGSDHISNLPVELTKFNHIGLSQEQLDMIFSENPKRIFKLKP
ncbi:amidohydrolase family protein [Paenibacillus soyae]|uniref:Amidohydrolase family protein n=1 Tax=Paenibacillus soyae TaxID=2969249 RepID=A0A9X2MQ21_9BACL|nr:amidohydrolase family protein [Paenibacillus soyae]MCR2804746.1 amidohydrolase family protein [Paenibacillus soyae]